MLALVAITGLFSSCDKMLEVWDKPITHYLRIDTSDLNVKVGQTVKRKPSYQSTKVTVIYTSADPSIATVDDKGAVTGVKEGTTTISVTPRGINDYYNNKIFYDEALSYRVIVGPADPTPDPSGDDDDDDDETVGLNEDDAIDQGMAQSR